MIAFISKCMKLWNVDLNLQTPNGLLVIPDISIKTGIYQGDSLSPLLFCLALFPLSSLLNQSNTGYQCKKEDLKVNHLLYVDDLKLLAKNDKELEKQLEIVKSFSDDIKMEFGLEKCAKTTFIKGKLSKSKNVSLPDVEIRSLEHHETYKYLGVEENEGQQHKLMKTNLTKEYLRRVRALLKTELSAKNKISAIGSLAVPVLQYSFGIIKWTLAEIKNLDRRTRKLLTMHGALHPKSDVDRLYVPRREGGRGLRNIELSFSTTTQGLACYLELKKHEKYLGMVFRSRNTLEAEGEIAPPRQQGCSNITIVKSFTNNLKKEKLTTLKEKWRNKKLYGQILEEVEKEHINKDATWAWLKYGDLKSETESLVAACQEQAIATHYRKNKIFKTGEDPKCRLCRSYSETIHHILSGCPILAKKEYLDRHNAVAAHLHWSICREYNIIVSDKWYKHKPDAVVDSEQITLLWDMQIQTDREVRANKPDLVLRNKLHKTCLLIDVAIPSDYNLVQKEAEKILKYKDLLIEVQRMWDVKAVIIPVVIGATGLVTNSTTKNMNAIPGKHNLLQLQKTVLLQSAHIARRVL